MTYYAYTLLSQISSKLIIIFLPEIPVLSCNMNPEIEMKESRLVLCGPNHQSSEPPH